MSSALESAAENFVVGMTSLLYYRAKFPTTPTNAG